MFNLNQLINMKKTNFYFYSIFIFFFILSCSEEKREKAPEQKVDTVNKKDTVVYRATESDKARLMKFYEEITKYWTSEEWMKEFVKKAKEMFNEANIALDKGENPNPKIQEMGEAFKDKLWQKYLDILYDCGFKSEEEKNIIEDALSNDSTIVKKQNEVETLTKDFNAKLMEKINPLRDAFLKRAEEMGAKRKLNQQ